MVSSPTPGFSFLMPSRITIGRRDRKVPRPSRSFDSPGAPAWLSAPDLGKSRQQKFRLGSMR